MAARDYEQRVEIPIRGIELDGDLVVPAGAFGLVLFAHGSGSSRASPRNRFVAQMLRDRGLGTLLFDLLTPTEEVVDAVDAHLRFDIPRLAGRLEQVRTWVRRHPAASDLPIGYFGASTGAAAALIAAAERPDEVKAVVSRGGRPDLAGDALVRVRAPTMLIVGGRDPEVLDLNWRVLDDLWVPKQLAVIPGATHLFEEPGALEEVARLAAGWFKDYLGVPGLADRPAPSP